MSNQANAIRNRFVSGLGWAHPFLRMTAWFMNGQQLEYPTIASVRVYLGERLALYFAFMSFYTVLLVPLVILSLGFTIFHFFAINACW